MIRIQKSWRGTYMGAYTVFLIDETMEVDIITLQPAHAEMGANKEFEQAGRSQRRHQHRQPHRK
jgi:hypothetical protein